MLTLKELVIGTLCELPNEKENQNESENGEVSISPLITDVIIQNGSDLANHSNTIKVIEDESKQVKALNGNRK